MSLNHLNLAFICLRSSVSSVIRIICAFDDGAYNGTVENVYGGVRPKYLCRYICSYKHAKSESGETC